MARRSGAAAVGQARQTFMNLHLEVLGQRQRRALETLGPILTKQRCYLAGGTGVALHLGHRRSIDLDWFAERLEDPVSLAAELRARGIEFETERVAEGSLEGRALGVRVSVIQYGYPLLKSLVASSEMKCRLASTADLAAMKLAAVAQRGAKKDFVDVFGLGVTTLPLTRMLAFYRRKYSIAETAHVLYSLVYFTDADTQPMPPMLWKTNWRLIKGQLREWVRAIAN
jgi:hypothetical protein